ncbi:heavy-metal-associated domain-containing protein [Salinivirga cyanobacteriivorans]
MKNLIRLLTLLLFVSLNIDTQAQKPKKIEQTVFTCNLDCSSCETKIMRSIPYEKGVKNVKVDLANKEVVVEYKKSKNSDQNLIKAFKKIGYKARVKNDSIKPINQQKE